MGAARAVLAGDAGITDEEIDRIAAGPGDSGWSIQDQALLRAVDELLADAVISDATWAVLAAELDHQQLIDLVFTVGAYDLVGDGVPHLRRGAGRRLSNLDVRGK